MKESDIRALLPEHTQGLEKSRWSRIPFSQDMTSRIATMHCWFWPRDSKASDFWTRRSTTYTYDALGRVTTTAAGRAGQWTRSVGVTR